MKFLISKNRENERETEDHNYVLLKFNFDLISFRSKKNSLRKSLLNMNVIAKGQINASADI